MNAPPDEHPWPRSGGLVLGRYEVLGVIGRGGMGVVSAARDVQTGRRVAVKRVRAEGARAEREAMAAARLRHPAIVELLEAEATAEGWIIVSELVEGADLRAVLRTGEVPELDIARFAGSIVRGLAHAHQHGVVHRDVKPANILCPADPRRAGAWAKLTDFGVAALAGAETLTAVGDVVGTMAYMAPEQAKGDRAGAPADVFALAVVVYEALAGVNPRRGSTAAETAARALTSMPPLARMRPDLPSGIHAALDHCLELDPGHRGGLADLDEGLRRLAALASAGGGRLAPAPTAVTRLEDRRPRPEPLAHAAGPAAPAAPQRHDGSPPHDAYADEPRRPA
ncbi:MAG: serine/threonine-protein kinase, partial [Solirubrobacteraceae bacterium]|nr:serine/threonine-protein kinase [Patulibacter sp.]